MFFALLVLNILEEFMCHANNCAIASHNYSNLLYVMAAIGYNILVDNALVDYYLNVGLSHALLHSKNSIASYHKHKKNDRKRSNSMTTLDNLRKAIDTIDDELIALLEARFNLCIDIGLEKQKTNRNVLDTSREQAIYEKLSNSKYASALNDVFKHIMHHCKTLQRNER